MPKPFQVQVSIPMFTNIPEDVVTNTFNFSWLGGGTPTTTDYTNLEAALAVFYATIFPLGAGLSTMSLWMRPSLTTMKIYDLADTIPRVPRHTAVTPLAVKQDGTSSKVPPECSIVLSYKANPIPGVDLASSRGRIYLGGLGDGAISSGNGSSFPTPYTGTQTNMKSAATTLDSNTFAANWNWVVYSRKLDNVYPVAGGFIDNALDTQRRRGNAATARVLWP